MSPCAHEWDQDRFCAKCGAPAEEVFDNLTRAQIARRDREARANAVAAFARRSAGR